MAWFECTVGSGGGGGGLVNYDVVIDWALYSHPSAFDTISLPSGWNNYEYLGFTIVNSKQNKDLTAFLLNAKLNYYLTHEDVVFQEILKVKTSELTSSDSWVYIPILNDGNNFYKQTQSQTKINNSRILGNSYPWSWQNLWLIAIGFNE